MEIGEALNEAGALVVGPARSICDASKLIRQDGFDLAVVNVKLQDGEAYPLIEALQKARVPVVFLTGHERTELRRDYQSLPHLTKPFEHRQLVSTLAELTAPSSGIEAQAAGISLGRQDRPLRPRLAAIFRRYGYESLEQRLVEGSASQ